MKDADDVWNPICSKGQCVQNVKKNIYLCVWRVKFEYNFPPTLIIPENLSGNRLNEKRPGAYSAPLRRYLKQSQNTNESEIQYLLPAERQNCPADPQWTFCAQKQGEWRIGKRQGCAVRLKTGKTLKTIAKRKAKKKYYVRIRIYKTVSGKNTILYGQKKEQ